MSDGGWSVWEMMRRAGERIYAGLEAAGEGVAEALGLNDSRYQWYIDEYMKQKEMEEEEKALEEEQAVEQIQSLESGRIQES
mmetsp:Transcript_1323/g.4056  ORF Transcript_1323/g.4056 Transcript_1323/m.4056 type:complete len:82 (+) Transcript_1323:16-261(+)